ncbi:MAG TPA: PDZ domain-containing protein [Gemmatimonadales bacterium]|nr:PDZ domain-containing protein [Gemmatimonadales bacterium]
MQAGSLTVSRRGVDRQIRIGAAASGLAPEPLGLTLARGVPLLAVSPGSAAARAGLRAGDRLLEVDGRAVRAESDVASLLRRAARRPVLLVYERDGVLRGAPFGPTQ